MQKQIRRWAYSQAGKEHKPMSPLMTMLIMVVAGLIISYTTGEGAFFLCFAMLAPLMAVSAKRAEDRRHQKRTEELLREMIDKK